MTIFDDFLDEARWYHFLWWEFALSSRVSTNQSWWYGVNFVEHRGNCWKSQSYFHRAKMSKGLFRQRIHYVATCRSCPCFCCIQFSSVMLTCFPGITFPNVESIRDLYIGGVDTISVLPNRLCAESYLENFMLIGGLGCVHLRVFQHCLVWLSQFV